MKAYGHSREIGVGSSSWIGRSLTWFAEDDLEEATVCSGGVVGVEIAQHNGDFGGITTGIRECGYARAVAKAIVEESVADQQRDTGTVWAAAVGGQTILLLMDQTDIEDRFAILMVSVRVGDRSLPLVWQVEAGAANIGFEGQRQLLEQVKSWLPAGVSVMLLADRFYPSAALLEWLKAAGWQYRLRLKGNLVVDVGCADITTTGDLAAGVQERYEPQARLFAAGIATAIGVLHEPGHKESWIIAMECLPSRTTVLDYGSRWGIEPSFSDFKSRGFQLEDTQLEYPDRLDRLILIMTLAMYWCVAAGKHDAASNPTPTEKKPARRKTRTIPSSKNSIAARSHGSSADCGCY